MSATRHCSNLDVGSSDSANRYSVPFAARNAGTSKFPPGGGVEPGPDVGQVEPGEGLPDPGPHVPAELLVAVDDLGQGVGPPRFHPIVPDGGASFQALQDAQGGLGGDRGLGPPPQLVDAGFTPGRGV